MTSHLLVFLALSFALASSSSVTKSFQARDHLTLAEQEIVKDTQILDKRIEVFSKAADRRLLVLNGVGAGSAKQLKKDSAMWGELPTGTRAELIRDIAKILDEAITNIDDVSSRDERNPLIPKALRKLAAEATRIVEAVRPLQTQAKGDAELASFEELMENADSILQAANKLPPPTDKKEKSKGEKVKGNN